MSVHRVVAGGPAADDVEAGGAGVHVQPRHAQRVVVVPDRRGAVARSGTGRWRSPGPTARRTSSHALRREEVVPGALARVAVGDVRRGRQVPGLGVAVALVADADGAVHVRARSAPGPCTARASRRTTGRDVAPRRSRRAGWPSAASGRPAAGAAGSCRSPSLRSLIHLTRTGRADLRLDRERRRVVQQQARCRWRSRRRRSPTPWSRGSPAGRICCANCFIEIS